MSDVHWGYLFLNYLLKLSHVFLKSKSWDVGFEAIPRNRGTSYGEKIVLIVEEIVLFWSFGLL